MERYNRKVGARASHGRFYIPDNLGDTWGKLSDVVNQKADEHAVEKAYEEGVQQQKDAGTDGLQRSDGFFGYKGLSTKARNKGAEAQFKVQKDEQAKAKVHELSKKHVLDPEGFKESLEEFKQEYLDDVPVDLQPTYTNQINNLGNSVYRSIDIDKFNADRKQQLADISASADNDLDQIKLLIEQHGANPQDPNYRAQLDELQVKRIDKLLSLKEAKLITEDDYNKIIEADKQTFIFYDIVAEGERIRQSGGNLKKFILDLDSPNVKHNKLNKLTREEREAIQAKAKQFFSGLDAKDTASISKAKRLAKSLADQILEGRTPSDSEEILGIVNTYAPEHMAIIENAQKVQSKAKQFATLGFEDKAKKLEELDEQLKTATLEEQETLSPLLDYYKKEIVRQQKAISKGNALDYASNVGAFELPNDFNIADTNSIEHLIQNVEAAQNVMGTKIENEDGSVSTDPNTSLNPFTSSIVRQHIVATYDNASIDERLSIAKNINKLAEAFGEDEYALDDAFDKLKIKSVAERKAMSLMSTEDADSNDYLLAKKIMQGAKQAEHKALKGNATVERKIQDKLITILPTLNDGVSIDEDGQYAQEVQESIAAIILSNRLNAEKEISLDSDVTDDEVEEAYIEYYGVDEMPEFNGQQTPPIMHGVDAEEWEDKFSSWTNSAFKEALGKSTITDGTGMKMHPSKIRVDGIPYPINDNGDFIILMEDANGGMFALSETINGETMGSAIFNYGDVK
ncbi:hypothetical protein V5T82_14215 [Magnetovibrio sp. PR-2]|uniref:hypothetical protein n=1 Tax=Magnetovibrio sp. PR-2 TaxID=3120356 RepID=UPI002FCE3D6A